MIWQRCIQNTIHSKHRSRRHDVMLLSLSVMHHTISEVRFFSDERVAQHHAWSRILEHVCIFDRFVFLIGIFLIGTWMETYNKHTHYQTQFPLYIKKTWFDFPSFSHSLLPASEHTHSLTHTPLYLYTLLSLVWHAVYVEHTNMGGTLTQITTTWYCRDFIVANRNIAID